LRIYIAPCGIGLGHITRAVPIASELERQGHRVAFSTYLDGLEFARKNKLPTYEAVPINFKVRDDGSIDFKRTAATSGFSLGIRTFLRQVTREIRFMKHFRPDVVFSDSRASSLVAARLLRIPVVLMLNQFRVEIIRRPSGRKLSMFDRFFFLIANLGWLFVRTVIGLVWATSQIILIPDLPHPYTICLGNLAIPKRHNHKVRLIGPIVDTHVRHRNVRPNGIKKRMGFDSNRPLVYAAISGPRVEREVLSRILINCLRGVSARVILSRGDPTGRTKPRSVDGIEVYDWVENQEDLILASDVIVSRAGHGTIMKSLSFGKPMILIPIPDHTEQQGNAKRATSLNVAHVLDQRALTKRSLASAIEQILHNPIYRTTSARIGDEVSRLRAIDVACRVITGLRTGS